MRSSRRARAAFLLLYGALLAWQIDRWCFTRHGLVSTWSARHDGLTASAGTPAGISQSFAMGADGLDGLWLQPVIAGGPLRGELLIDLLHVDGDTRQRIERVVIPASDLTDGGAHHVPFRPVRSSRGVTYQIGLRHVHMEDGPAIDFAVTRDDVLRSGRLFVDGGEQWGDLVFATSSRRATLPYWLHEILRPWPAWARAWPTVVLVLLAFNAVLAWACARAVGGLGNRDDDSARVDVSRQPAVAARMPLATAMVLLPTVLGVALAGRPTGRFRSLDLIAALPDAHVETTWPSLHAGVSAEGVVFAGRIHRAIVALPTSRLRWTVDVPRGATLRFGAAMRPDMWERRSDGIQMRVRIEGARGITTAAEYTLVPMLVAAHKRLHPGEVALQAWAGQRVTIVLETTPERWGNAVNDVPVWTEPRIEWPRTPAAGTARVVRP